MAERTPFDKILEGLLDAIVHARVEAAVADLRQEVAALHRQHARLVNRMRTLDYNRILSGSSLMLMNEDAQISYKVHAYRAMARELADQLLESGLIKIEEKVRPGEDIGGMDNVQLVATVEVLEPEG